MSLLSFCGLLGTLRCVSAYISRLDTCETSSLSYARMSRRSPLLIWIHPSCRLQAH